MSGAVPLLPLPICLLGLNRRRLTACKDYDVEGYDQGVSVNGPLYEVLHRCLFGGFRERHKLSRLE